MGNFQPPVVTYFDASIKMLEYHNKGLIKLDEETLKGVYTILEACIKKFAENKDVILQQIEEDDGDD